MKIAAIDTLRLESHPNLLWVEVHTDQGLIGLGETFYGAAQAEAQIHAYIAPILVGDDPLAIERHWRRMLPYVGYVGSSAEMRALSAVDIALWDLLGQATGRPIHQLLGGKVREHIRVYNTCAGPRYVQSRASQGSENFGIGATGRYEDLDAFLHRADELAVGLIEMGIGGMKIWPFDFAAEANAGAAISARELDDALTPFRKIRQAVGDKIDIMAELHALWLLPPAREIVGALDQFTPRWIEDPVRMDHLASLSAVARATRAPIAAGETLGGRGQFRALLETNAVGLAIMDIAWGGGLSEARKVAAMCEAWHVPFAAHDCTGPVTLAASTHLALATHNVFTQEIVRAFYYGWYADIVTALPPLANGHITAPEGSGLGLALLPDFRKRAGVSTRRSAG
ncbi:MAG TPA: mandelate racemase/muconate lactonizing enzyme family protein [Alphaproteobacteria bacterium]|nr:mandelate racemase/muconate lactonizing enzyme family protein [Alphaproteobacteria bacterium]